ncbi:MAG: VOC family protein [Fimbriimonadaceae bacterium]|nr:VOC family protein [Fimbriimonadaceae bacterium]
MATETQDQYALAQGRTFVWHEVYSPNGSATIDFYTKALGFGTKSMDMGPMGTYHMLTKNDVPVCGVMDTLQTPGMENVPPHWATYTAVDDLDASLATCEQHGAKVVVPPIDVPTVGRMAMIMDPQGAHIWLFKDASEG